MNTLSIKLQSLAILIFVIAGLLLFYQLSYLSDRHPMGTQLIPIILSILAYLIISGKYWWTIFLISTSIGGYFYVEHKIYPDEIGIALTLIALMVGLLRGKIYKLKTREPLTNAGWLLVCYFALHMSWSLYSAQADLLTGVGNIVRVYASGIGFLVFFYLFYKYGSTGQLKPVFLTFYACYWIRVIVSLIMHYYPDLFIFTSESFFQLYPSTDLRFASLNIIYISISLFYFYRHIWIKHIFVVSSFLNIYFILYGQGRIAVVVSALIMVLWALAARKFRIACLLLAVFILAAISIQSDINVFERLPFEVQRSLAFLPGVADYMKHIVQGSDQWHYDLFIRGFEQWSSSIQTILLGNRVDPFGLYDFYKMDYWTMIEIASSTGRHESMLWTVTATLGLVGFTLYAFIFIFLFRDIFLTVVREGITDFNHAIYAIACINVVLAIGLCWIRGGFPGFELMFGVFAKALYEDNKLKERFSIGSPNTG